MSPFSVGEQDLGLAALTGKFFSHWELKDRVRAVLLQQRCRDCPKCNVGMKQGLEVRACYQSHRDMWGCMEGLVKPGLQSEHAGHILHPHTPVSSPAICPAWTLMGTEPTKPSSCNISRLRLRLNTLCFLLTAFFANKVEHESRHCNGKGLQRQGSSSFERVYTAK